MSESVPKKRGRPVGSKNKKPPTRKRVATAKAAHQDPMVTQNVVDALEQYRSEASEDVLVDDGIDSMEFMVSLEGSIICDYAPEQFGQWRSDYECFKCGVKGHSDGPFYIRALCVSCGTPLTVRRVRMKDED
jgi:hypothetical protein